VFFIQTMALWHQYKLKTPRYQCGSMALPLRRCAETIVAVCRQIFHLFVPAHRTWASNVGIERGPAAQRVTFSLF